MRAVVAWVERQDIAALDLSLILHTCAVGMLSTPQASASSLPRLALTCAYVRGAKGWLRGSSWDGQTTRLIKIVRLTVLDCEPLVLRR